MSFSSRLRGGLLGGVAGGALFGGATALRGAHYQNQDATTYLPNAGRFGLMGIIPGAIVGAMLGGDSPIETNENNSLTADLTDDELLSYKYMRQAFPEFFDDLEV